MPKPTHREQILAAGLRLFRERGFNATSVQDVTGAAGAPKGSFYNHFGSKEDLGLAALARYQEAASLDAWLADASVPPLDRLRGLFGAMRDDGATDAYACGCLMGSLGAELANTSPALRAAIADGFAAWAAKLAPVVRQGQADGTITRDQDADDLARFMIDAWQGTVLMAKVDRCGDAHARFVAMIFGKLLLP